MVGARAMTWAQWLGLLPFVLSATLALGCVLGFKAWHRRNLRRSPLAGRKIGQVPGQALMERVSDHEFDMLGAVMLMYLALPIMFMTWVGMRIRLDRVPLGWADAWFVAGALAVFGYGLVAYVRTLRLRDRARDGLLAERVCGMQLNRLVARDCIVMHDLPCEGFNIDHVVIAPRGVYAVETKSFRKPRAGNAAHRVAFDGRALRFPDFVETAALEQASRQAAWLSKVLREALNADVRVIPALALPGWLVDQSEDTWRTSKVKVFTPMGGGANFMAQPLDVLDPVRRNLVRDALAVRYPEIAS